MAVPNQWAERLPDGQDDDGGMIGRGIGNVSVFRRDVRTGKLSRTSAEVQHEAALAVAAPTTPSLLRSNKL